jgi:hypothetical protein
MGNEREAAIANMESMGFARADIDAAMRAAFFNPDRAVEYLLTVRRAAPLRIHHVLTYSRAFPTAHVKSKHKPHRRTRRRRPSLLPPATQVRPPHPRAVLAEMSPSTCSRPLHRPVRIAGVLVLVLAPVALEQVPARSTPTASSSCATIPSSSSYDRSYNSSRKCSSPFYSRSAQETHSWRR